jgi:hypothetical protein
VKAGLNFDDIRSFEIPDVDRAQQKRFSEQLRQVDLLKTELTEDFARREALFNSLQHRAFRGGP